MEKQNNRKRMQNKLLAYLCSYTQHTWSRSRLIQHLKKLAQMESGKSVPEFFVREKEKLANKGTDKQYVNASVKHSTTLSLQNFVPNFKILRQVVPEKSLTEKNNRQIYTHCDRKGFVCRGYNDAAVANFAAVAVVNNKV